MREEIVVFLETRNVIWREFDPKTLIYREEFTAKCAMNHCGKYGKTWTCPPGIGDLGLLRSRFLSFPRAILFSQFFPLEDPYDVEGMDAGRRTLMNLTYDLQKKLADLGGRTAFLGAGSCELCSICSFPTQPCRRPGEAMPAIEALGIDVWDIARKNGMKYYHGPLTVTYFSIVFFEEG